MIIVRATCTVDIVVLIDNKILSALSAYEPELLVTGVESNGSYSDSTLKIISIMSDLYDKELVSTISWAKQIPGEYFISFLEMTQSSIII